MESLDYKALYELQDKVLERVFQTEREFYLTGGTCLNRFYFEKRYSDDLDFLTLDSPRFFFAIRSITDSLASDFSVERVIEAKSLKRCRFSLNAQLRRIKNI